MNYKKMMNKAKSSLSKELDLRKFVYRQRLQTTALLGLLSGRQSFFVDKMSQMVIRESSNLEETSLDSGLSDWQVDNMDYATRMVQSSNKVDERLINLYRLKLADQLGIHIGIKNSNLMLRHKTKKRSPWGKRLNSYLTRVIDKGGNVFTGTDVKSHQ